MASKTLGLYSQASNTLATAFHNLQLTSGGGGGSQTLQQTLVNGNTTGGNDIIQSAGDALRSDNNANLRLELDGIGTTLVEQVNIVGSSNPIMTLYSNVNSTQPTALQFYKDSFDFPQNADGIGIIDFYANTDMLNKVKYASIEAIIDDVDDTVYSGTLKFNVASNASYTTPLQITSSNIIPTSILDSLNSQGTSGQVLSSTGTGLQWITNSSSLINITDTSGGSGTYYPTFVSGTSGGQTLRVDSSTLVYETSGNRLGVNTATPLYNLDVSGATRTTTLIDISASSGLANQILSSTATGLRWISPFSGMTATGGIITTYYEGYTRYTAHTFIALTDTFTITSFGNTVVPEIDIFIVGGGGAGGAGNGVNNAGGGGAGMVLQITGFPLNSTATLPLAIPTTVGLGGSPTINGVGGNGSPSTFAIPAGGMVNNTALTIQATGGGGGGGNTVAPASGVVSTYTFSSRTGAGVSLVITPTSASGGGAQGTSANTTAPSAVFNSSVGDLYSSEYVRAGGYRGGVGTTSTGRAGCSGGGSSTDGGQPSAGVSPYVAGTSLGHITYWSGSKVMVGGGGLGSTQGTGAVNPTSALYGGGLGEVGLIPPTAGTDYTGGGGGGVFTIGASSGAGGAGTIIVRYKS